MNDIRKVLYIFKIMLKEFHDCFRRCKKETLKHVMSQLTYDLLFEVSDNITQENLE